MYSAATQKIIRCESQKYPERPHHQLPKRAPAAGVAAVALQLPPLAYRALIRQLHAMMPPDGARPRFCAALEDEPCALGAHREAEAAVVSAVQLADAKRKVPRDHARVQNHRAVEFVQSLSPAVQNAHRLGHGLSVVARDVDGLHGLFQARNLPEVPKVQQLKVRKRPKAASGPFLCGGWGVDAKPLKVRDLHDKMDTVERTEHESL